MLKQKKKIGDCLMYFFKFNKSHSTHWDFLFPKEEKKFHTPTYWIASLKSLKHSALKSHREFDHGEHVYRKDRHQKEGINTVLESTLKVIEMNKKSTAEKNSPVVMMRIPYQKWRKVEKLSSIYLRVQNLPTWVQEKELFRFISTLKLFL